MKYFSVIFSRLQFPLKRMDQNSPNFCMISTLRISASFLRDPLRFDS
uniref:Uncharacterized protein n=1 Tax=Rhizophora mucronata TaxID=61149 RepID=A0A2P2L0U8_RHIMU